MQSRPELSPDLIGIEKQNRKRMEKKRCKWKRVDILTHLETLEIIVSSGWHNRFSGLEMGI